MQDLPCALTDQLCLGFQLFVVFVLQSYGGRHAGLENGHVHLHRDLHLRADLKRHATQNPLPVDASAHPPIQLLYAQARRRDVVHVVVVALRQHAVPESVHGEGPPRRSQREELHLDAQVQQVPGPRLGRLALRPALAGGVAAGEQEDAGVELLRRGAQVEDGGARPEDVRHRHPPPRAVAPLERLGRQLRLRLQRLDAPSARPLEVLQHVDALEVVGILLDPHSVQGDPDLVVWGRHHLRLQHAGGCTQGLRHERSALL
mmetsp:Transcript_98110/g.259176  ORF Transcript_98110/g.259176 Transcript_98110/m.259176 type:complete len:260 (+) Transcript_98110:947-1726(+)